MGTGSTRRRQLTRANSQVRAGDWGAYYKQNGGWAYDPGTLEQAQANWYAQGGGIAGAPTALPPTSSDPSHTNQVYSGRYGTYDPDTNTYTPNLAGELKQNPVVNNGLLPNEADALSRWLAGRKKAAQANAEKKRTSQLDAFFEKNYYDPSNDIRASYAAQEAAINKQYDQMLGRVTGEHAAAEKGVRVEGQHLQTALTAIGADAAANLAASNKQIDQEYAKALKGVNADYATAAKAIKSQGGRTADLAEAGAASKADLREGHVADAALGARYQQMLAQEINDRQATGATVTTAGVQDLARILQTVRDNTSAERLSAVAKIEANMAGDLAQAKSQKAQAKYSLFLSVLKSGGSLGQAGLKIASPGTVNSAIQTLRDGNVDYSKMFSGVTKSKDPNEVALGQKAEESLLNGTKTPQQIWAEWQANPDRAKYPVLGDAIMQVVGYWQALQTDPKKLKKYLAERGYK